MARWRTLPGGLDPAIVEFVGELRRLKDGSGRSLRRVAAATGYSTSSWERYLSGRLLPPRGAVEALAAMAGADTARLLARYDSAADAWSRSRPAGPPQTEAGTEAGTEARTETGAEARTGAEADAGAAPDADAPPAAERPGPRPVSRLRLYVTAVVAAAVGATVAVLATAAGQGGPSTAHPAAVAKPVTYSCAYVRKDGRWYSGNSTTGTDLLTVDMYGPDVAELQCLLRRDGISPGGVDGNFGPLTESAVIAAQKRFHLDVDGQVGPLTWAALRG